MIAAIDTDLRALGLAVFQEGKLVLACSVKNPHPGRGVQAWQAMARSTCQVLLSLKPDLDKVILEVPNRQWKGRLDDIFQVVGTAGAIAGLCGVPVMQYSPHEWKGSVPKKVHNERILSKVSPDERATVRGKLTSDIIDAIGIGLFYLKRLK